MHGPAVMVATVLDGSHHCRKPEVEKNLPIKHPRNPWKKSAMPPLSDYFLHPANPLTNTPTHILHLPFLPS